ncbi:hypothetical protein OHV05_14540 [Kitasatospora sp. NBC_00070]|uniref:hypothetical protein n=1 Tax=Kitasatospora sp. NBC_00070 TaxID=2975962 RepID=UPI0032510C38
MGSRIRKSRIPRQRGRRSPAAHVIDLGRGTQPLVVVVPQRRPLAGELALATVGALWRGRTDWAPTWAGAALFTATGVLSLAAPAAGLAFAVPALLVPAGWAVVRRWHPRSAVRRRARTLTRHVLAGSAALAWTAAAVLAGPVNWPLAGLLLAGTTAGQAAWWHNRRTLAVTPLTPVTAPASDAVQS